MEEKNGQDKVKSPGRIRQKLSKVLTKRNQAILFVVTIILAAVSIYDVVTDCLPTPVNIIIYICTALCFFSSCALWVRAIRLLVRLILFPFIERHEFLQLFIHDYRLRTTLTALPGVGINLIFAIFNAVLGIVYRSAWNGTLAAYYTLLCIMRFASVLYAKSIYVDKQEQSERELKVYRNCGRLLAAMSVALAGAVILLLNGSTGKTYAGYIIYGVAAYTFYKLVMSVLNMAKARRERSLLAITLRNIGHCDALVSLLYLQTALFSAFGNESQLLIPVMNGITGMAVSLAALVIGLYMSFDGKQRQRKGENKA